MLEIKEPHDSLAYLVYTESGSKNNSGGLHHRKVQNKSVKVFANISNPKRCVLQLYQKYMSLRLANAPPDVFYLLPLCKTLPDCWYQPRPVGHNPLSHTVQKLHVCTEIGAEGY